MDIPVESHPLEPFIPLNAHLLMLGSFPPKQTRWSMEFYYPNFQNDMWRIFGLIFFNDKDHFVLKGQKAFDKEKIVEFMNQLGVALNDTAHEVRRLKDNASDKFLEIVTPVPLDDLLSRIPDCRAIVVTGQKAMDTILSLIDATEPRVGGYSEFVYKGRDMRLYRMPSSSRAYPMALKDKAAIYEPMLTDEWIFGRS